ASGKSFSLSLVVSRGVGESAKVSIPLPLGSGAISKWQLSRGEILHLFTRFGTHPITVMTAISLRFRRFPRVPLRIGEVFLTHGHSEENRGGHSLFQSPFASGEF